MLLNESDKAVKGGAQHSYGVDERLVPAAITDTGCERELNEDRYAVVECPSGLAWIVCDGMGGAAGGELAAQLAIDAIRRDLENLPARPPVTALKSAILEANRVIVLRRQNQVFAQMGTTIVSALFSSSELIIGHVGDSRAYLVRAGQIEQLTTDHTYVQGLVDKGQITQEQALSHPQAHVLTRAIGSEPGLETDIERFWLWPAPSEEEMDVLILCTDGLYSHVSDEEIAEIATTETPQRCCVRLVELAKSRGGFDNITLAVVPVGGQLRCDPPAGVEQSKKGGSTRGFRASGGKKRGEVSETAKTFWRSLAMMAVLSLLGVMLVVVGMVVYLRI